MKPPDRKNARGNGQVATGQNLQEHRQITQSTVNRKPQSRFGQVTAGDLVPLVMAEFDQLAADPIVDRAPRRREADQSRLLSILDELERGEG